MKPLVDRLLHISNTKFEIMLFYEFEVVSSFSLVGKIFQTTTAILLYTSILEKYLQFQKRKLNYFKNLLRIINNGIPGWISSTSH